MTFTSSFLQCGMYQVRFLKELCGGGGGGGGGGGESLVSKVPLVAIDPCRAMMQGKVLDLNYMKHRVDGPLIILEVQIKL